MFLFVHYKLPWAAWNHQQVAAVIHHPEIAASATRVSRWIPRPLKEWPTRAPSKSTLSSVAAPVGRLNQLLMREPLDLARE